MTLLFAQHLNFEFALLINSTNIALCRLFTVFTAELAEPAEIFNFGFFSALSAVPAVNSFYFVVLNRQFVLGEQFYGLRICDTFLLENSCGECFRSVVAFDLAGSLDYYWSFIIFVCAKVNRAAAYFASRL